MIIESIKQLSDSSVFDYYSIETISELELHLRTLVSLIEIICKSEIRIRHELREKIYAQLKNFAEIHFRSTEVNEQGFNKVFKSKFEDFNPSPKSTTLLDSDVSNEGKVYKDVKRNYNIDFLLLHLRDTLHCMRDDENKFLEVWRRTKELLRKIFGIAPGLIKTGISHGADLLIDNGIELLFKNLQETFKWKYPISSWYYEWRTLLELNFNIQNFLQECSLCPNYGESLLFECLWHCVSKSWSTPISNSESLTNKKHFVNNLLGMEPLAFPHSLWFGALDITQELITKTQRDSTLGICYYLALESLQKAPSSFIRFKAKEVLIKLSKRKTLFYDIIEKDFNNYKQSLDSVKRLKSHQMIEAIRKKSFYDEILVDTNKSNVNDSKKKGKAIITDSLASPRAIILSGDSITDIIITELSCPITYQISKTYQILSCCKNFISLETLQRIIDKNPHPICPLCRKTIDLNSLINLPQSEIFQGIHNHFIEDNYDVQDHNQNTFNENSDEEINISKLKSQQKFRTSNSIRRKFFKTPKFLYSSLRKKANIAYKLGEFETAINALTEILEEYPTSYSLQCYRAKVYIECNKFHEALEDLDSAIEQKPNKFEAYLLRGITYFKMNKYKESLDDLTRSLEIEPNNAAALGHCGITYYMMKEYDESLWDLTKSLEIEPNNVSVLNHRGIIYYMKKEYDKSLLDLTKSLEIEPSNKSLLDLIKSLEIEPNNASALNYRGIAYYMMKEYDNSLLDLTKTLEIEPNNAPALNYRGIIYYMKKEYNKSLLDLTKTLEIEPNNASALNYRSIIYYIKKEYNKSLLDLTKSLDIEPSNKSLLDLKQSLEIEPNNSSALSYCGIAYYMMNEYDKSLLELTKSCI
ncbi:hypothetical protein C2G38_2189335 [Gigaspora rosea]|uniref:Uncharacterized protein n=1 Tax=Gigaspora rosea TaxID=44941 RepID=A0A397V5N6_9GLOM|nr:hypothetical protein C2G38_2189335 [Gigaspora rosea]